MIVAGPVAVIVAVTVRMAVTVARCVSMGVRVCVIVTGRPGGTMIVIAVVIVTGVVSVFDRSP